MVDRLRTALLADDVFTEIVVTFANTGQEDERTLQFVDRCDREWGLGVVWLEAVVDPRPHAGTRHRVVDFASASRAGEPFEAVIAKYGIPNKAFPSCSRELKEHTMKSYIRHELGWKTGNYRTAVGIRADEIDRQSADAVKNGIFYPLIGWGVTKADVLAWWKQQPFDLYLPEHLGNCTWCWKKSLRKHLTLAVDHPHVFDFPRRIEPVYKDAGAGDGNRRFFREKLTVFDIFERAQEPFEKFVDGNEVFDPELDVGGGCSESCDVFTDG